MARHVAPNTEPAITTGMVTALVAAVIGALVAFGVPVTDDQREALLVLVVAGGPIVAALFIRGKVTPNAKVAAVVEPESGLFVAGPAVEDIKDGTRVAVQRA